MKNLLQMLCTLQYRQTEVDSQMLLCKTIYFLIKNDVSCNFEATQQVLYPYGGSFGFLSKRMQCHKFHQPYAGAADELNREFEFVLFLCVNPKSMRKTTKRTYSRLK